MHWCYLSFAIVNSRVTIVWEDANKYIQFKTIIIKNFDDYKSFTDSLGDNAWAIEHNDLDHIAFDFGNGGSKLLPYLTRSDIYETK